MIFSGESHHEPRLGSGCSPARGSQILCLGRNATGPFPYPDASCMVYFTYIWLIFVVYVGKYSIHGIGNKNTTQWQVDFSEIISKSRGEYGYSAQFSPWYFGKSSTILSDPQIPILVIQKVLLS